MISFIIALPLISGCSLTVPDMKVFRDKGDLGAHYAYTNSSGTGDVNKPDWDLIRFGQFCMNEEDFAKNQLFIEEACQITKGCKLEKLKENYMLFVKRLKK